MKLFNRKRVLLGLMVILVAAATVGYENREYLQQLPIGCAFKAKSLCAAVFVSGRDPVTAEREDIGFSALFKLFKAKINRAEKSVTCSLLGVGLYEKKAVYIDRLGGVLLSGVPEETVRAWRPAIPRPERPVWRPFLAERGERDSNPADRMYPQLPGDTFFARGYQGQTIAMIPSRKLVVVRLGMTYDENWGMEPFIKSVLDAIR